MPELVERQASLEGWCDRANGSSNRKVSQDVSMDLKQLSIEIAEMSGMGVKLTGGTYKQFARVVYGRI